MNINQIKTTLSFMQRHDPNGFWLEWFEEIKEGESSFDSGYVLETLKEWGIKYK